MIQIILFDNWMESADRKITVNGKKVSMMDKKQKKELIRLCATADKTEYLTNGVLYQIK